MKVFFDIAIVAILVFIAAALGHDWVWDAFFN